LHHIFVIDAAPNMVLVANGEKNICYKYALNSTSEVTNNNNSHITRILLCVEAVRIRSIIEFKKVKKRANLQKTCIKQGSLCTANNDLYFVIK